jgi:hypothetical protein
MEVMLVVAVVVCAIGWVWLIELPARRDPRRRHWRATKRRDDGSVSRRPW